MPDFVFKKGDYLSRSTIFFYFSLFSASMFQGRLGFRGDYALCNYGTLISPLLLFQRSKFYDCSHNFNISKHAYLPKRARILFHGPETVFIMQH